MINKNKISWRHRNGIISTQKKYVSNENNSYQTLYLLHYYLVSIHILSKELHFQHQWAGINFNASKQHEQCNTPQYGSRRHNGTEYQTRGPVIQRETQLLQTNCMTNVQYATAWHVADLIKHAPPNMCYQAKFGHFTYYDVLHRTV